MKYLFLVGLFFAGTAFGQASGYVATGQTGASRTQVTFNIPGTSTYTNTTVTTTAPLVIAQDLQASAQTTAQVGVVTPTYSFSANTLPAIRTAETTVIATSFTSTPIAPTSTYVTPVRMEDVDLSASTSGFTSTGTFDASAWNYTPPAQNY